MIVKIVPIKLNEEFEIPEGWNMGELAVAGLAEGSATGFATLVKQVKPPVGGPVVDLQGRAPAEVPHDEPLPVPAEDAAEDGPEQPATE